MFLYGNNGLTYTLLEKISKSSEGDFFDIDGSPSLVAKIFHAYKQGSRGREAIVNEWTKMYRSLDETFTEQVVIPQVALYDSNDKNYQTFCGYLMKKQFSFQTLDQIYTQNELDYWKKVRIGMNLCILTNQIHTRDIVIGDYSPKNVLVFPTSGYVKLINADSLQLMIECGGKRRLFPCMVGVKELLAPEIQRRLISDHASFTTVDQSISNPLFTVYSDRYSLAYLLFSLLMGGISPFGRTIDDSIIGVTTEIFSSDVWYYELEELEEERKGNFLFRNKLYNRKLRYAPKYGILSKKLRCLFERAFIYGATDPIVRPDEREFFWALLEYYKTLKEFKCGNKHYLSSEYHGRCEWCRIDKVREDLAKGK